MKIIRIIALACLPAALFGLLLISSCGKSKNNDPIPNLVDLIKSNAYGLGNVLNGVTNENSKFTGFKIVFAADGSTATLTTGGASSVTVTVSISVSNNLPPTNGTITFSGTPPSGWPASLSNVSTNADGSVLNFNASISSSSIVITPGGKAAGVSTDYTFNLVRQ